jgi:hypothetical protein
LTVPRVRRFVSGISPRRHGFDLRPVPLWFVMDKVALEQVFLRVLQFEFVVLTLRGLLMLRRCLSFSLVVRLASQKLYKLSLSLTTIYQVHGWCSHMGLWLQIMNWEECEWTQSFCVLR